MTDEIRGNEALIATLDADIQSSQSYIDFLRNEASYVSTDEMAVARENHNFLVLLRGGVEKSLREARQAAAAA